MTAWKLILISLLVMQSEAHQKLISSIFSKFSGDTGIPKVSDKLTQFGVSPDDLDPEFEYDPPEVRLLMPGDEFTRERYPRTLDRDAEQIYYQVLRIVESKNITGRRTQINKLLELARAKDHSEAEKLLAYDKMLGAGTNDSLIETRETFEKLAGNRSFDAYFALGFMHSTGLGLSEADPAKGLVYYHFAATGGNPLALMAMGYRYLYGIGVHENCEESLIFYRRVAKIVAEKATLLGSSWITKLRLMEAAQPGWTSSNYIMDSDMIEYYRYLAEQNDHGAQTALGVMYLYGNRGVEQNFALAHKYFYAASDAGNEAALAYLGRMFLHGTTTTPTSYLNAYMCFFESAVKGDAAGESGLGRMYLEGKGVTQNYKKAYNLLNSSASNGGSEGQFLLGEMYAHGLGVKKDLKRAAMYYHIAAQQGHIQAQYNIGRMHAKGAGIPRSCEEAVYWFKSVAEQGRWAEKQYDAYFAYKNGHIDEAAVKYALLSELSYETAQTNLAYILDQDETTIFSNDTKENLERAHLLWHRSADQNYGPSHIQLGDNYFYGRGTSVDYEMAVLHYKVAAERHHIPQAMYNLGYMYENGYGLAKDLHLSKRYYDLTVEHNPDAAVPISLVLLKLKTFSLLEMIDQHPIMQYLDRTMGHRWDIVVMTMLAGLIAKLVLMY